MSQRALPASANVRYLKNEAKALLRECRTGRPPAIERLIDQGGNPDRFSLKDVQNVIAREYGFAGWREMRGSLTGDDLDFFDAERVLPFLSALRDRDVVAVERCLERDPEIVDARFQWSHLGLSGQALDAAVRARSAAEEDDVTAIQKLAMSQYVGDRLATRDEAVTTHALLRLLVAYGGDVNADCGFGGNHSAVEIAAWEGDVETLEILIDAGADLAGDVGLRAIRTAANHEGVERIEYLAARGVDVSPAIWIRAGMNDRFFAAVAADASILRHRDGLGMTPLDVACDLMGYNFEWSDEFGAASAAARRMVDMGAEVDVFAAATLGRVERLRSLLAADRARRDASVNEHPPLWFAAAGNQPASARALLDAGANPNSGRALHLAASVDRTAVFRVLLDAGADLTDEIMAISTWHSRDTSLVVLALERGGNPNAENGFGAIHWPSWQNHPEHVRILLAAGADPNLRAPARNGDAPLHFATRHAAVVEVLLAAGGDPHLQNANAISPLEKAEQEGASDTAALMRAAR